MISGVILIIIAVLLPPVAVAIMAGCGADLLINICLTILGYFPGHIHAFYLMYIRHKHRETGDNSPAGGVFSPRIYAPNGGAMAMGAPVAQQGYAAPAQQPMGYEQGTTAAPAAKY